MQTTPKLFFLYWLPVVIFCAAIFIQSCFSPPDLMPAFLLKDKMLHMVAYGLLAALFYRACRVTWPGRLSPIQLMVASILFATLYGVSDEYHQSFVVMRQADGYDVFADFMGSLLGVVGYLKVTSRHRQNG